MKNTIWKLSLLAAMALLASFGRPAVVLAAEDNGPGQRDQLQQLERRINEIAERQEQLMRRLGAQAEHQGQPVPQWNRLQGNPMPQGNPMSGGTPNLGNAQRPMAAGMSAPMPGPDRGKDRDGLRGLIGLMLLAGIVCNILLSVWIFTDIRKRGEGSGIFVALALVAGIPAAIIYSIVRIGDKKA